MNAAERRREELLVDFSRRLSDGRSHDDAITALTVALTHYQERASGRPQSLDLALTMLAIVMDGDDETERMLRAAAVVVDLAAIAAGVLVGYCGDGAEAALRVIAATGPAGPDRDPATS